VRSSKQAIFGVEPQTKTSCLIFSPFDKKNLPATGLQAGFGKVDATAQGSESDYKHFFHGGYRRFRSSCC